MLILKLIEMNIDKQQILQIVKTIHSSQEKNKKTYFKRIYESFAKKYPHLFEMACSGSMDISTLEFMLGMMDKMEQKETDQNQASVQVGEELFKRFVNPNLKPVDANAAPAVNKGPIFNITTSRD
jgi:hypothetical protein